MPTKPLDEQSLSAIASMIRRAIQERRYRLRLVKPHAVDRMLEYEVDRRDIIDSLGCCRVTHKELRGNWRYRTEGGTFENGRRLAVIVEIESDKEEMDFLVITVWALE